MTVPIAPDLGAWMLLCRVQWDSVVLDPDTGALYDGDQRLPTYLTPHVRNLIDYGYLRLTDPDKDRASCRRVIMTMAGEHLLELVNDLRQCWVARQRAGLPRCHDDLDSLSLMLDASNVHLGYTCPVTPAASSAVRQDPLDRPVRPANGRALRTG